MGLNKVVRKARTWAAEPFKDQPRTVLVVGTFRSATNAAKSALKSHYHVEVVFNQWFWKHGVPPTLPLSPTPIPRSVPIIVMCKDPVALNESLFRFWRARRPELQVGDDISKFVRSRFVTYDNTGGNVRPFYYYPTPTEYWNQFYFSWLNWRDVKNQVHFVKCEDLMTDADGTLRAVGDRFDLSRRSDGPMSLPNKRVGPKSPELLEEGILGLSDKDRDWIHTQVDPWVARNLGYS